MLLVKGYTCETNIQQLWVPILIFTLCTASGGGGLDCKMRMISRGVVVFANTYTDAQLYIIITNILLDVASIRWHCIGLALTYQYFHTF